MQTVKRFDYQHVGKNVQTTPQGFLIIPAYTARTGIQEYRKEDGTVIREFRPEEEVFSDISMSSLRTAVMTNKHPSKMVCPKSSRDYMVGHTDGMVTKKSEDEHYLATHLVVTHQDAIDAIMKGRAELSNGYTCELDFTPGEYKGQRYDAIQRNIVNNHIALVDIGRAGRNVRLKLDSLDAIDENNEEKTMKIKIGAKEFEVNDEIGNAFKEELTARETELTKVKNDAAEAVKEKDKAVAKCDSLTSDLEKAKTVVPKMDAAQVNTAVKARIAVLDCGKRILDAETVKKLDDMSDLDIKKAVIKADSKVVDESKLANESYVDARFDHIAENLGQSDAAKKAVGTNTAAARTKADEGKEDETSDPNAVRQDAIDKAQNADSSKSIGITKDSVK